MYAKKDYKPVGMSKGELMNLHKSFGLLVAGGIAPRILLRLTSRVPGDLPGNAVEHLAGKVAHFGLYALLFVLPGSGIAMGYFGGKGLPFFGYHIAGAPDDKKDGEVAKNAFKVHKQAGQALEYLTLAHFGATGWHLFKGHSIMRRIVPGMQ